MLDTVILHRRYRGCGGNLDIQPGQNLHIDENSHRCRRQAQKACNRKKLREKSTATTDGVSRWMDGTYPHFKTYAGTKKRSIPDTNTLYVAQ